MRKNISLLVILMNKCLMGWHLLGILKCTEISLYAAAILFHITLEPYNTLEGAKVLFITEKQLH
jgi:hypothetical protein